jgi:chromosome segregation ATPase
VSDATACYTYASKIRKRREQLVGQEDQLDAQMRYLRDVNLDTEDLNAELNGRIEVVTARTDTAVDSLAQSEMTESELAQLREILDIEVSSAQRQLDAASRELQAAEQYRSRQLPPTAALDAEIARLQALLNETQRQTSELVAQRQRIEGSHESR